jgi:hypothetical protein
MMKKNHEVLNLGEMKLLKHLQKILQIVEKHKKIFDKKFSKNIIKRL